MNDCIEINGDVKIKELAEIVEIKGRCDALVSYIKRCDCNWIDKKICANILGVDLSEEEKK